MTLFFLQEVAVESFNFYGYKEIVNLNRERRGTAVLFKESIPVKNVCQLSDGRGVAVQFGDVVLINIYAPSGSQNRQSRNVFFADGMTPLLQGRLSKLILGGTSTVF